MRKRRLAKAILRIVLCLVLLPVVLVLVVGALLYVPSVQQWAVDKAASVASDATGMDISVRHISLKFPLDLGVEHVSVVSRDSLTSQPGDTIARVGRIVMSVGFDEIFDKRLIVRTFDVERVKVNTGTLISSLAIEGEVGWLRLTSRPVDLGRMEVHMGEVSLADANVEVALADTTAVDTTASEAIPWTIYIEKVKIERTRFALHTAGDTMSIVARLDTVEAERGVVDLAQGAYSAAWLDWHDGALVMDYNHEPASEGLDPNHIALSGVSLRVDSVYYSEPFTQLVVSRFAVREKSGLEITSLHTPFLMDTVRMRLPALSLRTPDSSLDAEFSMDFDALADSAPGQLSVRMLAAIGKQDIALFSGALPQEFIRQYPNRPLTIRASADGNLNRLDIAGLDVNLPTAFRLSANGHAVNLMDSVRLGADIALKAAIGDVGFVLALADTASTSGVAIPQGIAIDGRIGVDGGRYEASLEATEGGGRVSFDGYFDAGAEAYRANADIAGLDLSHFLPQDSLGTVSVRVEAEGKGFDFFSPQTRLQARAELDSLRYGSLPIDLLALQASVAGGKARLRLTSDNALLRGSVGGDALLSPSAVKATLTADITQADLQRLRLTDYDFALAGSMHADMASDLGQSHSLSALVDGLTLTAGDKKYHPKDLTLNLATTPDTTWAVVSSGDLHIDMAASGGYETLLAQVQDVTTELDRQMRERDIDQTTLRQTLPTARFRLVSGSDNPAANFMKAQGVAFADLSVDFNSSPATGVVGDMHLLSLVADSVMIDTINFHIAQGSRTLVNFRSQVRNAPGHPQLAFNALLRGTLYDRGAAIGIDYYDGEDSLGVRIAANAEVKDSGIIVHLAPERPVLAYKSFALNKDNYIFLGRDKRVWANVDLAADDGTRITASSDKSVRRMLQDITLTLQRIKLDEIASVVPYAPDVEGTLGGSFRVVVDSLERLALLSSLTVDSLALEGNRLGDIGSRFAYLLDDEHGHTVEAHIVRNEVEVGTLRGTYDDTGDGYLNAKFKMTRFPLSLANGFVPDRLVGMRGYGNGDLEVKGSLSAPIVDGQIKLDSAHLVSVPYGINMRMDDDPVRIVSSNLLLENLTMYSPNDDPLSMNGNVDFSNLDNIGLNITMRANNYQLIDAKKRRRSVAYGKAFVNFFCNIGGTLNMMRVRGQLDVLGTTDLTYVLTDSPLSTDDQLKDLVTFTDFRDTTHVEVAHQPLGGIDMQLSLNIQEGARVKCALNSDESNYVSLEGGGELRMSYDPINDLRLTGRYTVTEGEMKYALPVIPLKTFTIKEGSYVEFTGEAMNPRLSIEATEEVKASVSSSDGSSRTVLFECGVKVTQTLSNMGLEFTLDAPEDMTLKNELAAMSTEDRGKVAVTMLTTGMYIGQGSSGSSDFSMNSALNSFLQSQINNITSSAMKSIDLSVGMDQSSDATGNTTTDYSFKFAKRLWNNRVNFVIGGKISSGSSNSVTNNDDGSFIDNVSLEYRLDATSMRYVKLFYDKTADDLLEGRITEYGAGFVWRKKLDRLNDLFRLRSNKFVALPERRDSTQQEKAQ